MTATFDPGLGDDISKVRQLIGDTDVSADPVKVLVVDETITAVVAAKGTLLSAAAELARNLAARFAAYVDSNVDGQGEFNGQRYKHYVNLATNLEAQARAGAAAVATGQEPAFAGISASGCTAQDVYDARTDPTRARNAGDPFYARCD